MIYFDPKEVNTYLDRIDEIPNDKYRNIFENYAKTRTSNEQEREELLNKIVERKNDARENIQHFLYKTYLNRKIKDNFFISAIEATEDIRTGKTKEEVQKINTKNRKLNGVKR